MCLARTLVTDPEVLLMDEPTSSLDPQARAALEQLARATSLPTAIPVIWVTHDLPQMRRIADTVVVMIDGRIADTGFASELDECSSGEVARFLTSERSGRGHDE